MTVTPNLDGHQPSPRITRSGVREDDDLNLELVSAKPKLDVLKGLLEGIEGDAASYLQRIRNSFNWWHSRWDGQTIDGRKWHSVGVGTEIWPWTGASDTRPHIIDKLVGQHVTVDAYALRTMKIQAKSSRPFADMHESQQATTLLNWVIGTHMQMEAHRETRFVSNWKNAHGASVIAVDWEQERRIDYVKVSLMTMEALTQSQGLASQQNVLSEIQGADMAQWQAIIADEANEDALIPVIQQFSPIVTKAQARKIIRDLRELKFAEVPIPYIYKSQPRWRAMRPMIDVFFDVRSDELNESPRWVAEPEDLTETELTDRIETANYDPGFVADALDHKGDTGPWTSRELVDPDLVGNVHEQNLIRIWRFKYRALDRGTPVLYETIFHSHVETEAFHGPCQYQHGKFGYHGFRFEYHDRPLISSRGISEIAYTWQNEIKKQRDGRTDRVDLTLRPPMLAHYRDVLKIKSSFQPGVIWPEQRSGENRWMPPPQYDPGSIEIEKTTLMAMNEHFGLFGNEVDPTLKQQRLQERADDMLIHMKPVVVQTWQLLPQYLPDAEVAAVVGPLSRPFRISRDEIQGQYQITLTVDMKMAAPEYLKTVLDAAVQVTSLDTTGIIKRDKLVTFIMQNISVELAEELIDPQQEAVTEKEVADERRAISLIIGSGVDQPLPQGSNYELRMQTDQAMLQELAQNPAASKKIQENPEVMQVIQNRVQFFQRQIQQQQNAVIGRMQVTKTFSKDAPQAALPMGQGQ